MSTEVLPALDLHEYRAKARQLNDQRVLARKQYADYARQEAEAERDFRKKLAIEFANCKTKGFSDRRSEIEARSAAADYAHRRDIAKSLAVSAKLRIEEIERASASLRHISERSEREA